MCGGRGTHSLGGEESPRCSCCFCQQRGWNLTWLFSSIRAPPPPARTGREKNIIIFHDDKLGSALALHTVPSKRAGSQPALGMRPRPQQQTEAACARRAGGGDGARRGRQPRGKHALHPACPGLPSDKGKGGWELASPPYPPPPFPPHTSMGQRKGHLLIKTQILYVHNCPEAARTPKGGFWGTRLKLA